MRACVKFLSRLLTVDKIAHGQSISLYKKTTIYTLHMGLYMFGWMYAPQAAWANMQMAFPHSSDTIYYKSDCIVTPQITERVKARRWINMATSMSKSENNITLCKKYAEKFDG